MIEKDRIGLRTQDFHEATRDLASNDFFDTFFSNTLLNGKAACLALHLRGIPQVSDLTAFRAMAAQVGVRGTEFDSVIRVLEELDYAKKIKSKATGKIKRIDLRIPQLSPVYHSFGEHWLSSSPTSPEQAGLYILDKVIEAPRTLEELNQEFSSEKYFEDVLGLAEVAQLLARSKETDPAAQLIYSPQAAEENPDALVSLSKKFPADRLVSAFQLVQDRQGRDHSELATLKNDVIAEAIRTGVLQPVAMTSHDGSSKTFYFSPRGGLSPMQRVVLDKARTIVACVRHGEKFTPGTKIRHPRRLLEVLFENKKFGWPRAGLDVQYGPMCRKGIGRVVPSGHDRFNFHVHDTEDNLAALRLAISMVSGRGLEDIRLDLDAKRLIETPGSYSGSLTSRPKLLRSFQSSRSTQRKILRELSRLASGAV